MKSRTVISICLAAAILLVALADLVLFWANSNSSSPPATSPGTSGDSQSQQDGEQQGEADELTQEQLVLYFEQGYLAAQADDQSLSLEQLCSAEVEQVEQLLADDGYSAPDTLKKDYLAWRMQEHPYGEDELFEEREVTMYATSNVNVRASYSADSDRLDGLLAGDSVTVTGIGQGDAEGWCRVIYDDEGSIGYVSANYLSETPVDIET